MEFQRAPLIQTTRLRRQADVSGTRMRSVIDRLREKGRISPYRTPAGHEFLTPPDAEIVFNELIGQQQLGERKIEL